MLQEAMLPVAYHKTCREKMKIVRKVHKGHMLCAGGQGKGGCQVKKYRFHLYLTNKFPEKLPSFFCNIRNEPQWPLFR